MHPHSKKSPKNKSGMLGGGKENQCEGNRIISGSGGGKVRKISKSDKG